MTPVQPCTLVVLSTRLGKLLHIVNKVVAAAKDDYCMHGRQLTSSSSSTMLFIEPAIKRLKFSLACRADTMPAAYAFDEYMRKQQHTFR